MTCEDCNTQYRVKRSRPCNDYVFRCKSCSHKNRNKRYESQEHVKERQKEYRKENSESASKRAAQWNTENL